MLKTTKVIKRVAFFGDAEIKPSEKYYQLAIRTAELLAKEGYIIVNGGGPGIMAAATKGARIGHGKVELVVLDVNKQPGNYEGVDSDNYNSAQKIYTTKNYPERLNKLIEIADAFVVFNGGTGTLSEVGMVWEQAKFEYGKHEPIIFVGRQWEKVVKDLESGMSYEDKEKGVVVVVNTEDEVLKALKQAES